MNHRYKKEIKNAMKYYSHWIRVYKEEKEMEIQDREEITMIIKQDKIQISELYDKLSSTNQTRKEDVRTYELIRNKEEELKDFMSEKRDSERKIKKLEAKIERINYLKDKLVIC